MEPLDQTPTSVDEFYSELDGLDAASTHRLLRLRLETIQARIMQSQRSRPVYSPISISDDSQGEESSQNQEIEEGVAESGKGKSPQLVAKALGSEEPNATGKAAKERSGNYFDCNICLEMAKDPVLTCCGHLFCWPCFYRVSYAYLKARECPVCKGEVADTAIIPIYGNGSSGDDCQLELKEAGLTIPPRPRAPRVESIRQQVIRHEPSRPRAPRVESIMQQLISHELPRPPAPRVESIRQQMILTGSHPVSTLSVQGNSSFSSLSSALDTGMNSAERSVQDLESYIHNQQTGGRNARPENLTPDVAVPVTNFVAAASVSPPGRNVDNIAAIGSEIETTDSIPRISMLYRSSSCNHPQSLTPDVAVTGTNSVAAASVSPLSRNVDNIAAIGSEIETTDNIPRISMLYRSSNCRRRNDVSRPQPDSLTPDVAVTVTNSVAAASVSPLSRNVGNIAAIGSEIETTDNIPRISLLYRSSNSRRNDVSRQVPDEPRRRRRFS